MRMVLLFFMLATAVSKGSPTFEILDWDNYGIEMLGANDIIVFECDLKVTATDETIFIPPTPVVFSPLKGTVTFNTTFGGITPKGPVTEFDYWYQLEEGESATFNWTVTVEPTVTGLVGLKIEGMEWGTEMEQALFTTYLDENTSSGYVYAHAVVPELNVWCVLAGLLLYLLIRRLIIRKKRNDRYDPYDSSV